MFVPCVLFRLQIRKTAQQNSRFVIRKVLAFGFETRLMTGEWIRSDGRAGGARRARCLIVDSG